MSSDLQQVGRGAPLPPNEPERLAALRRYRILDTLPEQSFDDIVALAAALCETPIALVSLVDADRQWFKARIGIEYQQTPRELSFCAHGILDPGVVMVVPDARQDERFRDNAFVTGAPHIRFYAGAPLVTPDGMALGTLCVVDTAPRQISDKQRAALAALARRAVSELELRRLSSDTAARRDALYAMLHQLTRELDVEVILQKAVQAVVGLNCWESVGISLLAPDGQHWQTRAEDRMAPGEVGSLHPLSYGVIGRAYRTGELQLVADAGADPDFFLGDEVPHVGSELAIPITFDGAVLGVLNLESSQRGAFGDDDIATARSITEALGVALKNAERFASLKQETARRAESEERYRLLFETMAQGVVYQRPDGRIIDANPSAERVLGLTLDQMQGRTSTDPRWRATREDGSDFPGDEHPAMVALRSGQPVRDSLMGIYNPVAETHRWLRVNATPLFRPGQAEPSQVYATFEDITERLLAERALRSSEEKYRGLMESLDSSIMTFDAAGRCLYLNDVAAAQLGGAAPALTGKTIAQLFPEPTASHQMRIIREVIADDRGCVIEAPVEVQGRPRWFRVSVQPIHDEHGRVAHVLVNATDIHSLKTTQEELLTLTRTLEDRVTARTAEVHDLYENAPTGYHSLDARGVVLKINSTELSWLGYTRDEVVGRQYDHLLTDQSRLAFREQFAIFKQRGWARDLELELVRKDSTVFPVTLNATAIYDAAGAYVMSRSIVVDSTERKKAEAALWAAHAAMEQALRMKDEFLATMSHELRTPLNAILGFSESLLEGVRGPLTQRQQDSVAHIEASGRHLLTLINDILDLSKIEAGRMEIERELVPVAEVCQASLQFIRELALKKQLRLSFALDDQQAEVEADPRRLKQMLVNLLSNAVKFTPAGGSVALTVELLPNAGLVRFSVRDTGIGISAENQARLFQPFTQLDSRLSRQHEGTGLGLALVRRMAELHGGTVTLTSELGQGSTFTITLPRRAPAP